MNFSIASKGTIFTFFPYLHALYILSFEKNIRTLIKDSFNVNLIAHFKKWSVPLLQMVGLMPVILHALIEVRKSESFALIGGGNVYQIRVGSKHDVYFKNYKKILFA